MATKTLRTIGLLLAIAAYPGESAAQVQSPADLPVEQSNAQAQDLRDAIGGGKLLFQIRPRYEYVDQDNTPDRANAFTMRTLLGGETRPYHDFKGVLEFINVYEFNRAFNSLASNAAGSTYPTVPDPDNTDVSLVYLDWTGLDRTSMKYGRQLARLNNLRVLGDVNFRQTPQTFDAVSINNTSLPNTELYAAYLYRQFTTQGTQLETRTPVVNARYAFLPGESFTAYGLFQDQPFDGQNKVQPLGTGFVDNSNRIVGARLDGAHPVGGTWTALYTAEYARQKPYADGNPAIDASYYHLGLGAGWGPHYAMVHQEKLGSNGGLYGYQTPLATLHVFQGWADQFVVTPARGLIDTWANAGATMLDKLQLYGEYHRFRSDSGSIDFGREIDLSATYPLAQALLGKIEFADYRTGDPASTTGRPNVVKAWVTLTYNY